MSDTLPDWIIERLDFDNNRKLQQRPVAEVFIEGNRPYYNVRRIKAEIEGQYDKDTVRTRLNELVEQGILKQEQMNKGGIYWLDRPESEWPIPPDANVEPDDDEPTVSEFFGQLYVQTASIGILGATISGILIWAGSLQASNVFALPVSSTEVLSYGLTAILVSYIVIILALVIWVLERGAGDVSDFTFLRGKKEKEMS